MVAFENLLGPHKLREEYPKINRNFDNINLEMGDLSDRIANIIAQSGTSDTEVVDLRAGKHGNVSTTAKGRADKQQYFINVEEFNGADDTVKVQAAVDYAKTLTKATVVFDNTKSYLLNQINLTGVSNLIFDGLGTEISLNYASNEALFYESQGSENVSFRNCIFTGVSDIQPLYEATPRHCLIIVEDSAFPLFENCVFRKFNTHAILLRNLLGGTYTRGGRINRCGFLDSPYDASTPYQAGIILGDDGEYSMITNSVFYNIPSAARFTNGANGTFMNNIVMQLNGGDLSTLYTDRAGIYAEPGSNAGKIILANNHINHNMTAQIPIILKGDPAKPQNPYKVLGNDVLVNGNDNVGYQMVLYDAPNSVLSGNNFRPASGSITDPIVKLDASKNVMMAENYFLGGGYAVGSDGNSSFRWSNNVAEGQSLGILSPTAKEEIINQNSRTFIIRVNANGTMGLTDKSGWTVTKPGVGQYVISHDIGSSNFGAVAEPDNETSPYLTSVVRSETDITVYTFDAAGTAVDIAFLLSVTIQQTEDYVL